MTTDIFGALINNFAQYSNNHVGTTQITYQYSSQYQGHHESKTFQLELNHSASHYIETFSPEEFVDGQIRLPSHVNALILT